MADLSELRELRNEYVRLAGEIASMYGLTHRGKPRVAAVMRILSGNECERLIQHLLQNPSRAANEGFDRYYGEKHEFYKRKLVDRLKSRLEEAGHNVLITTEESVETGRYDITIVSGRQVRILNGDGEEEIVIEIKGSLGIALEHVERYLWNNTVLIIVRVVTGHVTKLKTSEYADLLTESLKDLIKKAERVLRNKPVMIRGAGCRRCPAKTCPHNDNSREEHFKRIAMRDEEFNFDLDKLLKNTYPTIEKVVEMVMEELNLKNKKALVVAGERSIEGGHALASAA